MRIGTCPTVIKHDHVRPARVTACVVVCVPHQHDYYTHRFDVLRLCLGSLRAHTRRDDYDLFVLDNGSCAEVVDYLRAQLDAGHIDHLVLSARNIGKINACRMLFDAAPGEIVAYSDDDVFFEAGWLPAQLAILDTYPRVGMVSARPVRKQFAYGNAYLKRYLEEFPGVRAREGHFIPIEWEREFLHSLGRIDDTAAGQVAATHTDTLLECAGLEAYSTAAHFQFVAPKAVILAALSGRDRPRIVSEERLFEEAIDGMGYARLSTAGRHVRHIGNAIGEELRERALAAGLDVAEAAVWRPAPPGRLRWARRWPWRGLLARVNRWSYFLLNHP
jgi:glycosyltransferase involved in cell wall biosynthesis